MSEENGSFKPVQIDVTDEHAFKTSVVQYLQLISDQTRDLPTIRKKVETHDRIVQYGKWSAIPILAVLHAAVDSAWHRILGGH